MKISKRITHLVLIFTLTMFLSACSNQSEQVFDMPVSDDVEMVEDMPIDTPVEEVVDDTEELDHEALAVDKDDKEEVYPEEVSYDVDPNEEIIDPDAGISKSNEKDAPPIPVGDEDELEGVVE